MRAILNIDEERIKKLDELCLRLNISRAEAIRHGIDKFIKDQETDIEKFFGMWKKKKIGNKKIDGLKLQLKLRGEWDD